uniref:Uncharacterized protein n=1 Tax=Mus musculus TaxID=10090 RepID=Q8CAV8_MOUSE|nr:unnamed protein product [Mus musculus]
MSRIVVHVTFQTYLFTHECHIPSLETRFSHSLDITVNILRKALERTQITHLRLVKILGGFLYITWIVLLDFLLLWLLLFQFAMFFFFVVSFFGGCLFCCCCFLFCKGSIQCYLI